MIYLDHAATTPVPVAVADCMRDVLVGQFGNPSSQYAYGQAAKNMVEQNRAIIAKALNCPSKNLIFTSCGTESDNWALQAAAWNGRHTGKHIITTSVEHNAILDGCTWLERQGFEITYLRPDAKGNIQVEQVEQALREDTILVSMMLVNNETGNVFPIKEVAQLLKRKKSKALLHSDAVQAFLKVDCQPAKWGVDLMSLSAHKLGGPKGIGAIYVSDALLKNIRPLLPGGGQENGLRSGTEATAQIAGFAKAVELRCDHLSEKIAHMAEIKTYCLEKLQTVPGLLRVGEGTAPHILSVSLPGYPSGNIINDLDAKGICISAGSACHKGKASHVVTALGLDKKTAAGVIRISFGPETSTEEIDALVTALTEHQRTRFPMF